jgi:anti-sigma B factor antagonist
MNFATDARIADDGCVLLVRGEIDIETGPLVAEAATAQLARPEVATIVMDLSGVDFMDSAGLAALVTIRNACHAAVRRLELQDPSPPVRKLLTITGLDDVFSIVSASSP